MADGPFESEDQVREALRSVYEDSREGRASLRASGYAILNAACAASDVRTGDYDRRIMNWLAGIEVEMCKVFADLIVRAREAGKAAATEGAETQWGVIRPGGPSGSDDAHNCGVGGETFARQLLADHRRLWGNVGGLVTREITPWKDAPDA